MKRLTESLTGLVLIQTKLREEDQYEFRIKAVQNNYKNNFVVCIDNLRTSNPVDFEILIQH
ncbi:MAG: hypothetical protein OEZ34_05275, partial [Spirochaetia bacterium]|nr:hypothetical protein [Spirochaetia bacterium]